MTQNRPIVACVCCGKQGKHMGRRLIFSCYWRHYQRGTLDRFPRRPPADSVWTPTKRKGLETLARYGELAEAEASAERIRWELSLTDRQILRYKAAWRHLNKQEAGR